MLDGAIREYQARTQRGACPRIKPAKHRRHIVSACVQARNRLAVLTHHLRIGRRLQPQYRAQCARVDAQGKERSMADRQQIGFGLTRGSPNIRLYGLPPCRNPGLRRFHRSRCAA